MRKAKHIIALVEGQIDVTLIRDDGKYIFFLPKRDSIALSEKELMDLLPKLDIKSSEIKKTDAKSILDHLKKAEDSQLDIILDTESLKLIK